MEKSHIIWILCRIQKNCTDEPVCKAEMRQMQRTNSQILREWNGMICEVGTVLHTLLCIKSVTNENLLYTTGNYIQSYPAINHNGKEHEKEYIDTCN